MTQTATATNPYTPGPETTSTFFDAIFSSARKDGMLVLDSAGSILRANEAFTTTFGYTEHELRGQHLRTIFTEPDRQAQRAEKELQCARQDGATADDAYVRHKDGTQLWVTGELYFVRAENGKPYFIKLMHRIGAGKMLDKFVFESDELVDTVFKTLKDAALVVIDTRLNVLRSNESFERLFGMPPSDGEPGRLPQMTHPLWKSDALRQRMRELIVLDKPFQGEEFGIRTADGREQTLIIRSKAMDTGEDGVRQFLLMIREREN